MLLIHGYVRFDGRRRVLQLASSDADVPLERASHPSRRGASSEDVEELQEEVVREEKHDGAVFGTFLRVSAV